MEQDLEKTVIDLEKQINTLTKRGLQVVEENELLKSSKEIAIKKAQMDYDLKMADKFIKSGAFKAQNAEQAYTLIQSGREMGLSPVEALNTLYIVNGTIQPYGAGMIALLTNKGYRIDYEESDEHCEVRVWHPKTKEEYIELATEKEVKDLRSKAFSFAPKHKLRFHAIRQVITFHLPHLFRGVGNTYDVEFTEWKKEQSIDIERIELDKQNQRIIDHIENAFDIDELEMVKDLLNGKTEIYYKSKKEQLNENQSK